MESCRNDGGKNCDWKIDYYDVRPGLKYFEDLTSKVHNDWSDWEQATIYWHELEKSCDSVYIEDGKNGTCWTNGSRWSIVYMLNASTMFLLALNAALLIIGAWNFRARGLGVFCSYICCCLNSAWVICAGTAGPSSGGASASANWATPVKAAMLW